MHKTVLFLLIDGNLQLGVNAIMKIRRNDISARSEFFISPEEQMRLVRKWNLERGWGFIEEDFVKLGSPTILPPVTQNSYYFLMTVVLEVSLRTVQQTFDEAWNCTVVNYKSAHRWPQLLSDEGSLRLLPGIKHEYGLRWRVIDLAANWDQINGVHPKTVRSVEHSPAHAVLWAAAFFPKWVEAMNGFQVPYVWIPGYESYEPVNKTWSRIPSLGMIQKDQQIRLGVRRVSDHGDVGLLKKAVPTFEELIDFGAW